MVDLGFTLLIIFMISTPLIQKEQTIPINLPGESKKEQAQPPPDTDFQPSPSTRRGIFISAPSACRFAELSSNLGAMAARSKHRSSGFAPISRCNGSRSCA